MEKKEIKKKSKNAPDDNGLNIAIECNLKIDNNLGVILSRNDRTLCSYQKTRIYINIIQFIREEPGHPKKTMK